MAIETDGLNMGPFFLSSFSYSLPFARIILSFASLFFFFFFFLVPGINSFLLFPVSSFPSSSPQFELRVCCTRKLHKSVFFPAMTHCFVLCLVAGCDDCHGCGCGDGGGW